MQTSHQLPQFAPIRAANLTQADLRNALVQPTCQFVRYEYCLSFLLVTLRYQSPVYFTTSDFQRIVYGAAYSLISLLTGPWGLPWGVILTVRAIWVNLRGGNDAEEEVIDWLNGCPVYQVGTPGKPA